MADDYKDEFLLRLQKSAIYTALSDKCVKKDTEVMTLIKILPKNWTDAKVIKFA